MPANSKRAASIALFALAMGPASASPETAAIVGKVPSPALEQFKALAGEWVAAEDGEMARKGELVARYAVTAMGTAVVETTFPGTAHEMVTVYHADGPDLLLTHYCVEGNQPRMRAKAPRGPRFDFAFDGGANLDPKRDRHMHSATVTLLGKDELSSEWTELADGKPVLVVKSRLLRKTR